MSKYNLTNSNTKLTELTEDTWYFVEAGRDHSNEVTAVKITGPYIYVRYIGGDFENAFEFRFPYSQDALNEFWQYEFRENYNHVLGKEIDDLEWVLQIATTPYTMLNDLSYSCKFIEQQEDTGHEE